MTTDTAVRLRHPTWPPRDTTPTMYDLPSEDPEEPGLPDQFHEYQPQLLRQTFEPPGHPASERFVAADMNLYYDLAHPLHHKRPDWFAVVGVPALYEKRDLRWSYVVWQEQVIPYLVVELLSPGTEKEDLGKSGPRGRTEPPTKWEVYEQRLAIPYYIVFSRHDKEIRAFVHDGIKYREQVTAKERLWLPEIALGIGIWQGVFAQFQHHWLRFYDARGNWIPTPEERHRARAEDIAQERDMQRARAEQQQARADREQARAQKEQARAEQERAQAQRYREKLLALGIDPDSL